MPTNFLNPKYNEWKRFFFVCNKNIDKNPIFLEINKNASTLKNILFTEFIHIDWYRIRYSQWTGPKKFNPWVSRAPHVKHICLAPSAHLVSTISRMSCKCCNITYFLCEYIVFYLCRLLCAARMSFDHLLLEFISSTIWTATIAKHWSFSSARHQLLLSV